MLPEKITMKLKGWQIEELSMYVTIQLQHVNKCPSISYKLHQVLLAKTQVVLQQKMIGLQYKAPEYKVKLPIEQALNLVHIWASRPGSGTYAQDAEVLGKYAALLEGVKVTMGTIDQQLQ